jgi:hypothetical protein
MNNAGHYFEKANSNNKKAQGLLSLGRKFYRVIAAGIVRRG